MRINDIEKQTIWLNQDGWSVDIIDQTRLPHEFKVVNLKTLDDAAYAIQAMLVRGAPLIGATAAFGLCLALRDSATDEEMAKASDYLNSQRPTAVNLRWALSVMTSHLKPLPVEDRLEAAYKKAQTIVAEDIETNRLIGVHGLELIKVIAAKKSSGETINVLTHCNAGWLATTQWGTATSPIYHAAKAGIPVHVWVDETRPRNQGASLTAYELGHEEIPHTIIVDNAGGHLMQHGKVDLCIVGTDRTAANGDVCNKIGTYLKALAAHDNDIPFYVALPSTTIDWTLNNGFDIPIEERGQEEVLTMTGRKSGDKSGPLVTIDIAAAGSPAANPAFDVTPAKYVTGLITEKGVVKANEEDLSNLKTELSNVA